MAYSARRQDGAPRRLRHRATSTSTGWAARTCCRSTARTSSALNITQQPSQGLCAGNQAPTTCFRTTQQGYPEGLNVPANFNPLNAPRQLHPDGQPDRQRAELARHGAARAAAEPARRRRLRRQQEPQHHDPRRLQPGAAERRRPRTRRCRRGGRSRASSTSRSRSTAARATTTRCRSRSSGATSRGLYLLNSFTWSRARDNASGHLEVQNGDNSRVNYRDLDGRVRPLGLRPAAQQHDQLRVGAAVRQGPPLRLGHERRCSKASSAAGALVGINTHDERRAGQPVLLAGGGVLGQRQPDLPAEPDRRSADARGPADHHQLLQPGDRRDPDRSDAAVRQRAAQRRARARRSTQLDLGLHKAFGLGRDNTRLEFRIEAFNLFNQTNFGAPNGNRSNSNFGTITSTFSGQADSGGGQGAFLSDVKSQAPTPKSQGNPNSQNHLEVGVWD